MVTSLQSCPPGDHHSRIPAGQLAMPVLEPGTLAASSLAFVISKVAPVTGFLT